MYKRHKKAENNSKSHKGRKRDTRLEINVRADRRIVEVWLTREEQQDQALKEKLSPLRQQFKAEKYTVVEFLSGTQALAEETAALLRYNRRRSAQLEVRRSGGMSR